jgi:two-component system sensor histidine kinase KdpD
MVAITTALAQVLHLVAHSSRVGSTLLIGVLISCHLAGSGPGYLTAFLSFIVLYHFVHGGGAGSYGYTAEDILVLGSFPVIAVLMCNLTARAQDQLSRAGARAATTALLFEATREFAGSDDQDQIRDRLAHRLARASGGVAVVWRGPSYSCAGVGELPPSGLWAATASALDADSNEHRTEQEGAWQLRISGRSAAAWRARVGEDQEHDDLLAIMADAGASAIARAELATARADAEARARTEDLRNAVLSSITEDLRTPLAAMSAVASELQAHGDACDPVRRSALTASIIAGADRLNGSIDNLLLLARLEGGAFRPSCTPFDIAEGIDHCVRRLQRLWPERAVSQDVETPKLRAVGDAPLFALALGHTLDSAFHRSPTGSQVRLRAFRDADLVRVQVTHEGATVAPDDLAGLFDKVHRAPGDAGASNTGVGLSIARSVVRGMGGDVAAALRQSGPGLVITLTMRAATA